MIAVIQRVSSASVSIGGEMTSSVGKGLLILLGIEENDDEHDISWLTSKILNMRIFADEDKKMNLSVLDVNGELLIVSQFTLHARTKKGNRPSFIKAAKPDIAIPIYEKFIQIMSQSGISVATGAFGADMQVELVNDGPVTIVIDSKNKV